MRLFPGERWMELGSTRGVLGRAGVWQAKIEGGMGEVEAPAPLGEWKGGGKHWGWVGEGGSRGASQRNDGAMVASRAALAASVVCRQRA